MNKIGVLLQKEWLEFKGQRMLLLGIVALPLLLTLIPLVALFAMGAAPSAGNTDEWQGVYPAAYAPVVSVGAADPATGARYAYSGFGPFLVERRRHRLERHAGRFQHAPPGRALRGEEQPHSAACSSRSVHNLTIASAVSSIERRVTSITGQPLSANMRRANASSALTASMST